MNTPAPSPIISNNISYKISSILDKENNKIILNCLINSSLSHFYYTISLTLEDFIKSNKNFKVYDDISEINYFINENIQENKIKIEKEKNDEYINLNFSIFNLKGNAENFTIKLDKKQLDSKEIINYLSEHVNNLIIENKTLNKKLEETTEEIKLLKNLIHHKMDSLIIENEKEQKFLEDRLEKIQIFSGKKFLTILLFRSSIHGDKALDFHKLCDYKNNLLFLIKTNKNKRFGGFTSIGIFPQDYNKCLKDNDAFCFSLDLNKIYNRKKDLSIYTCEGEIIIFLMDIFKIKNEFFSQKSICTDVREGEKYIYFDNQSSAYEINGGEDTFIVKELEVFQIYFI